MYIYPSKHMRVWSCLHCSYDAHYHLLFLRCSRLMVPSRWARSPSSGLDWPRSTSPMLTTLASSVSTPLGVGNFVLVVSYVMETECVMGG